MSSEMNQVYSEVRRALGHLYDSVYLQRSPLVAWLRPHIGEDIAPGQEAKAVRKILVEAIDHLAPGDNVPLRSEERRGYLVLRGRYIDQLSMEELAESMGISTRQLRRELRSGLEAVAEIVAAQMAWRTGGEPAPEVVAEEAPVRQELQQLGYDPGPVNMSAEVRNVQALVVSLSREMRVHIEDHIVVEGVVVSANRVLLRQVLLALYSWAIQNHCNGRVEVHLTLDEDQNVLFELVCCSPSSAPFHTQTPVQRVAEIVPPDLMRALSGQLECSEQKGDITLRLKLPCVQPHPVLLIDDNKSIHLLIRRYLSGLPYRVCSAYDATAGLEMAREEQPEVILLDIMMPDQDGWELFGRLKRDPLTRDIPVAICSVLAQEALAKSLDVAGYIKKPVTQASLLGFLTDIGLAGEVMDHSLDHVE